MKREARRRRWHEGDLRLEPLAEEHRDALKAACAEDLDIWQIYASSWDPDHFDATFDAACRWRIGAASPSSRATGWSG